MSTKRAIDFLSSMAILVVAAPVLVLVGGLVLTFLGLPILFSQGRPGWHTRLFTLFKFRTMSEASDQAGTPLTDQERLAPFGRWLRSTSLDELPSLWNVFKGDMSLVGPRPLLPEYLPLYTPRQARRHEVRPGLTGWAQVNGRNALSWEERLEMDVWYVDNRCFWLDLRILWMTVGKVLKGDGISQLGQATMEPFKGNRADG
jgi:lipopolysaccharide/colanic/teichoic acid biosynthesis glycosyltransferase